ncbi:MAG: D-alanyl-D-alanine carboxypeptidase/D-alanyl-D-alanine-endopeptidase, partial [Deltaproteobacteria bacterium]
MLNEKSFSRGVRLVSLLVLFLFSAVSARSELTASPLQKRVISILKRYRQDPANWGIQVRSLAKGDDLVSFNSTRLYMPASNLKLIVTACALDGLGPGFRYLTTVMADGELVPADSLLKGDLILRGSGDPTISKRFYPTYTAVWDKLAEQVKRAGISRITGALVVDNTLFEPPFLAEGWGWEDLMWWYAAPVSALAYNDNCIDVEVFPARRVGEPPEVRIKPPGSGIRLQNKALTVARRSEDRLIISRDTPGGGINLGGGIYRRSLGFLEHVAVDDPPGFAANA